MPNGEQSDIDMAKLLVKHLGIKHYVINIKAAFDAIIEQMELAEIEVLVRKAMKDLGLYVERPEIPDIGEKIEELKKEIETIRTTKPYTYRYLVENEDAAARETAKLKVELASYLDYVKELDGKIEKLPGRAYALVR